MVERYTKMYYKNCECIISKNMLSLLKEGYALNYFTGFFFCIFYEKVENLLWFRVECRVM